MKKFYFPVKSNQRPHATLSTLNSAAVVRHTTTIKTVHHGLVPGWVQQIILPASSLVSNWFQVFCRTYMGVLKRPETSF